MLADIEVELTDVGEELADVDEELADVGEELADVGRGGEITAVQVKPGPMSVVSTANRDPTEHKTHLYPSWCCSNSDVWVQDHA